MVYGVPAANTTFDRETQMLEHLSVGVYRARKLGSDGLCPSRSLPRQKCRYQARFKDAWAVAALTTFQN